MSFSPLNPFGHLIGISPVKFDPFWSHSLLVKKYQSEESTSSILKTNKGLRMLQERTIIRPNSGIE